MPFKILRFSWEEIKPKPQPREKKAFPSETERLTPKNIPYYGTAKQAEIAPVGTWKIQNRSPVGSEQPRTDNEGPAI